MTAALGGAGARAHDPWPVDVAEGAGAGGWSNRAHGGIAYLDEYGRNSAAQAAMFAFVSARTRNGRITGINILRVHEDAFAAFLAAWTDWLGRQRRVLDALNESAPAAA